jgi:hypothetical protein
VIGCLLKTVIPQANFDAVLRGITTLMPFARIYMLKNLLGVLRRATARKCCGSALINPPNFSARAFRR